MKDSRPHPIERLQPADQFPAVSTNTHACTDWTGSQCDPQGQSHCATEEELLSVSGSTFPQVPHGYEQNRIVRERDDRTTLEDKIRRAVDGWTPEERATAYWYLYACGMTLDRAKAIRHKGGFNA
jgi:hypothetical protein